MHLGVPDINNVIFGLPILLFGGILLAVSLRGLSLLPVQTADKANNIPFAIRKIRSAWPGILAGLVIFIILLIQLGTLQYGISSPIFWITAITIFAFTALVWDHRRGVDLSPGIDRKDILWLMGLLIVGFIIGTYRLQGWPDQLMGDEGNFWTVARDIATGTFKPPIFGNGVYSFPVLSSILQGWVLKLAGVTLWGWRFGSVLSGVITVVPLYLFTRDAFNRRVAVISSIALITSPYFLVFSRLGYNNIQALFITVLALYWLYIGINRNSSFLIFLAGCAAGLGFYTYFGARGTLIIAILYIILIWITKKIKFQQASHAFIMLAVGLILVVAPYFVFGFHQDAQSMGFKTFESIFFNVFNGRQFYPDAVLFKYTPPIKIGGNELFFNPKIYIILIAQGFIRTILAFIKPWLISEHFIAFPLAGTFGAIFFLIGLGYSFKNIKQPRIQLLIIWFFTIVLGFSTLNTVPPRHTHMVAIIPAMVLLIGIGLAKIARAFEYLHFWLRKHRNFILSGLLAVVAIGGLFDYFVIAPKKYHQQPDQIMSWAGLESKDESFVYIYQDASQKDFIPYTLAEFRKSVPFKDISSDDLISRKIVFTPNQKTVIFYPPESAEKIALILKAQWGDQLIQRMFYSTDGIPVLAAGMNTPFTFERDRSFPNTLLDAFQHPVFIILISLLFALLALVAFLPAARFSHLPVWFTRLGNWFNRPDQSQLEKEEKAEEDILLIEPSDETPPEIIVSEPPSWAIELSPSERPQNHNWLDGKFKSVSTSQGKDFYIRIHVPSIHLIWPHLPQGMEISIPAIRIPNGVLLILSVCLAIAAQFIISHKAFIVGILFYFASALCLIIWARRNPKWLRVLTNQLRISPRAEILIASLLLLIIAFTHFYDIGHRVYGLEADETKWTVQSWYSAILRVDQGEFASAHYNFLPVSFWIRSIFLRVFGMNFISARIETAFLSLLSAVFLYLLVRRLTASKSIALLSTLLFSFSFVELNLSHQALAETTPEVWMMSGFYFSILAIQQRRWWQFQTAGILLALGMMTYETFFPSVPIVLLFLFGFALIRIIRKKESARTWLMSLLLIIWPIIIVYLTFTNRYLAARSGYHLGVLLSFSKNGTNIGALFSFLLGNINNLFQTIFSRIVWTDALINWQGPFVNPILLPFLVVGFVYNLWNIRRPYFVFIPLWFLIHTIIAPIFLGAVYPRVLYTGLAPLMIWGAMGLWTCLAALRAWIDGLKLKFALPIFAFLLVAIIVSDYHIFTSSLIDPIDRQKRHELADLTAKSASSVQMVLFPYEPNQHDAVEMESHVILFSVAGGRRTGLDAKNFFQQLSFDQSLQAIWQDRQLTSLDLIFDKTAENMLDQRKTALQVILQCYPEALLSNSKQFFDVYHFDSKALSQPKCYESQTSHTFIPSGWSYNYIKKPDNDAVGYQRSSIHQPHPHS